MTWQIAVLGLVIGGFVGLSGMGAGVLTAPVLILLGIHPIMAVGTDLAYSAITKALGTLRNASLRLVNWTWFGWMMLGSVPGAVAGTESLRLVPGDVDLFVKQALGVVLIAAGVAIALKEVLMHRRTWPALDLSASRPLWIAAAGFVVGGLVGLTSVGSGSLFMIFLMLCSPLTPAEAVATDIANAAGLTAVAAVLHWAGGSVNLLLAGNLLVGAIPGIFLGGSLSRHIPARPLRYVLAILVLAGGIASI